MKRIQFVSLSVCSQSPICFLIVFSIQKQKLGDEKEEKKNALYGRSSVRSVREYNDNDDNGRIIINLQQMLSFLLQAFLSLIIYCWFLFFERKQLAFEKRRTEPGKLFSEHFCLLL